MKCEMCNNEIIENGKYHDKGYCVRCTNICLNEANRYESNIDKEIQKGFEVVE